MDVPFQFFRTSSAIISSKGFEVPLNESDYSYDEIRNLNNTGVALSNLLDSINFVIDFEEYDNSNYSTIIYNSMLKEDVVLMFSVLDVS